MKKSSIVIIASCCAGFILGAVIWFVLPLLVPWFRWADRYGSYFSFPFGFGKVRSTTVTYFFLWHSILAALGGYIGYGISRLIK